MEPTASPVTNSSQASARKRASVRVSAACQRCRQQKLKCDVQRPCTLCIRAGVTCTAPVRPTTWRAHDAGRSVRKSHRRERRTAASSGLEQTLRTSRSVRSSGPVQANENDEANSANGLLPSSDSQAERVPWTTNSASIQFLEEAFQQHEETSPNAAETSSFAAPQQPGPQKSSPVAVPASQGIPPAVVSEHQWNISTSARYNMRADMLSILPTHDIAAALVNNYFDRIHWFVLVFHQSDFRQQFEVLYDKVSPSSGKQNISIGFISVFMAVCILSLSYMDRGQILKLSQHGENNVLLQTRLLDTLRPKLLDVAAESSIEAVQTFVLLGSYYVYHGQPQLAWPICGWSLRIAQTLRLHRRSKADSSEVPDLDDPRQRAEETRKRCWWAVYEIETFCSMLYGYPLSISDNDCDAEPLCQYPERSGDPAWNVGSWRASGQATLLSYKVAMAQLSIIVRAALLELYSLSAYHPRHVTCETHTSHCIRTLSQSVTGLDRKLHAWASQLPQQLQIEQPPVSTATPCEDYLLGRPGLCANACSHYLFPLQSLSLKLALENARILVHRPLLSYRMSMLHAHSDVPRSRTPDPCQLSVETCQTAALQIAEICSAPITKNAGGTYAAAFVCLHLLTASITLSILTILNSMTPASHECKMGLRRLMEMQTRLSGRSIVAKQGSAVSKRLMALLLEKEMAQMLDMSTHDESSSRTSENEQDIDTPLRARIDFNGNTGYGSLFTGSCNSFSSQQSTRVDTCTCAECVATGVGNGATFAFHEDPATMQTIIDFEQAVLEMPNESLVDGQQSTGGVDPQASANLGAQDYSWIWSSNLDLGFP